MSGWEGALTSRAARGSCGGEGRGGRRAPPWERQAEGRGGEGRRTRPPRERPGPGMGGGPTYGAVREEPRGEGACREGGVGRSAGEPGMETRKDGGGTRVSESGVWMDGAKG